MTNAPEHQTDDTRPRTLWERLDDAIASVHPDLWLAGAVIAVVAPWIDRLA